MELTLKFSVSRLRTEVGARVDAVPCGRVAEEGGGRGVNFWGPSTFGQILHLHGIIKKGGIIFVDIL